MQIDQVAQQLERLRQQSDELHRRACAAPHPLAVSATKVFAELDAVLAALQSAVGELHQQQTAACQTSDEHFRLLVEGVRDYAVFMLDPQRRVVSWNAGAELLKGYRAEEILGYHFSCFYPDEDIARGKPEHGLEVAMAEGRAEDEGWRVRKDGSRFWAHVIITALHDETGQLRGFAKVTRDITERKRMEEAQRFLTEASTLLTATLDYETTLQSVARLVVSHLADWCAVDMLENALSCQQPHGR